MSGRRSETVRNKNRRKKLKKKFLLTSKKCWLIEQSLLPLYQHLVDGYSEKLKDEWKFKAEETDIEAATVQVKQEDDLRESNEEQQNISSNNFQVRLRLLLLLTLSFANDIIVEKYSAFLI